MLRVVLSLFALWWITACPLPSPGSASDAGDGGGGGNGTDAGVVGTGYPPPSEEAASRVGSAATLDIATWNIQNFPAYETTPSLVADIITSLDLDLVAVQEIADMEAFEEVAQRLPRHSGVASTHTYSDGNYQKVGFLYRDDLLTPTDLRLLYQGSGYAFPRPPMQVTFTVDDQRHPPFDFTAISLHLKAGRTGEDYARRADAMVLLETHVRSLVEGPAVDEVIILGDFNEVLDEAAGRTVFSPMLDEPTRYRFVTEAMALAGAETFLPSNRMYDHVITTSALDDERDNRNPVIPRLDLEVPGYESLVSDHLPVVLSLPVFP